MDGVHDWFYTTLTPARHGTLDSDVRQSRELLGVFDCELDR